MYIRNSRNSRIKIEADLFGGRLEGLLGEIGARKGESDKL
jgi:hypothetical protein